MKVYFLRLASACLVAGILTGCQTKAAPEAPAAGQTMSVRNNCCSLLYQLMEEQKDVSILRFIKAENFELKNLTKRIGAASKKGGAMLKECAKQDPSLDLHDLRLPAGEVKTRDAIAATKQHEILHRKGAEFELNLLLSQTEALSYGSHLAQVAAKNDDNPDRVHKLLELSREMDALYQQVFMLLLSQSDFHK